MATTKKKGSFMRMSFISLMNLNKEFKRIWEAIDEIKGLKAAKPAAAKPAKPKAVKPAAPTGAKPVKKGDVKWEPNQKG